MRITLRLIFWLVTLITCVAVLFNLYHVRQEKRVIAHELERRGAAVAQALEEPVANRLNTGNKKSLIALMERYSDRQKLVGMAVFDPQGTLWATTSHLADLAETPRTVLDALENNQIKGRQGRYIGQSVHFLAAPIERGKQPAYALLIVQNASAIDERGRMLWKRGFLRILTQALLIALATLLLIRWNITRPIAQTAAWLKQLRLGETEGPSAALSKEIFGPLEKEVNTFAKSLAEARAAAEEEARLRQQAESIWTPERLKEHVRSKLQNRALIVVANREPYMHLRKGRQVECIMPASGLVTALEPLLRACGGTWVAHGSGDADRDHVDKFDHLSVPPENPQYVLRRVWFSKEEEDGYYYGFSNEGLWPLCHIAHTRPLFRAEDWKQYEAVNQRFAEAVLEEVRDTEEPYILVQDYHFALLPRIVKEARPDARVALFWHIPWPNSESFGICPWQREILRGMLGADILGFHTQFHCNNFLDTVDIALESRIDWERFTVNRQGHTTLVKPFPISVDTGRNGTMQTEKSSVSPKAALLKDLGIRSEFLGIGVDRVDYTKGIVERFRGIERFLEKHKEYHGKFTFVEIGAPSRTLIKRYHDLMAEVESEVDRINWRFKSRDWKPLVFIKRHHSHKEIDVYYKAADVCMVTSLHDGMNLVAKEYVSARSDEDGTLILSRFTGAARELRDSLIVNPYDSDQLADALLLALQMDPQERQMRMRRMREIVRDNNVYRWGADLVSELAQIRLSTSVKA